MLFQISRYVGPPNLTDKIETASCPTADWIDMRECMVYYREGGGQICVLIYAREESFMSVEDRPNILKER